MPIAEIIKRWKERKEIFEDNSQLSTTHEDYCKIVGYLEALSQCIRDLEEASNGTV